MCKKWLKIVSQEQLKSSLETFLIIFLEGCIEVIAKLIGIEILWNVWIVNSW